MGLFTQPQKPPPPPKPLTASEHLRTAEKYLRRAEDHGLWNGIIAYSSLAQTHLDMARFKIGR